MKNTMAENMTGDIISDHRERMLNMKKYYPFFRLIDTSFSNFKDGKYEILDMGYIVMAVLRFFIEENNFKEKERESQCCSGAGRTRHSHAGYS